MRKLIALLLSTVALACGGQSIDDSGEGTETQDHILEIGSLEQPMTYPQAMGPSWTNWNAQECQYWNSASVCIMPTAQSFQVIKIPAVSGNYSNEIRLSGSEGISVSYVGSFGSPVSNRTQVQVLRTTAYTAQTASGALALDSVAHVACVNGDYNTAQINGNGGELVLCRRYTLTIDTDAVYGWATAGQPSSQHTARAKAALRHVYRWAFAQMTGLPSSYGSRSHRPGGIRRVTSPFVDDGDVAPGMPNRILSPCETALRNAVTYTSPDAYVNTSSQAACTD